MTENKINVLRMCGIQYATVGINRFSIKRDAEGRVLSAVEECVPNERKILQNSTTCITVRYL